MLPTFRIKTSRRPGMHGRTGRKKLGGRKEICPPFSDCARVVKKIFRRNFPKLLSTGGGGEGGVITKNSYYIAYFPQS